MIELFGFSKAYGKLKQAIDRGENRVVFTYYDFPYMPLEHFEALKKTKNII
jgi:hypothetical protein